ncbi:MAG: Hsp20/alpha crystallin family protein [Chloroflexota bacterium]
MLIRRTPTQMDRFFNEMARNVTANHGLTLDVHESENDYTVVADVPGYDADNIDIRLHDDVLTITAENTNESEEERGKAIIRERRYGKVSRSLRFPVNVNADAIEAQYTDGVLTLTIPKAEEVKPRRIEINRA